MEKNTSEQAPFSNEQEYQTYVVSLGLDPEALRSAASTVLIAQASEWAPDGRRYATQEEIRTAIEVLKTRGAWPEADAGESVVGRALMNKRRAALWAEGIVTRPFWI